MKSHSKGVAARCHASITSKLRAFFIRISNRANSITSKLPGYWFFFFRFVVQIGKRAFFITSVPVYWFFIFTFVLDMFPVELYMLAVFSSYLFALLGDRNGILHLGMDA